MERVIQPRDEEQWSALRPLLEAADDRNRQITEGAEADIMASLQEMARQLEDLLDAEQQERLSREVMRGRPPGPPPGRGAPPREGGPGPNRGSPPPEGGGPPREGRAPSR